jgi:hypothetical protein
MAGVESPPTGTVESEPPGLIDSTRRYTHKEATTKGILTVILLTEQKLCGLLRGH